MISLDDALKIHQILIDKFGGTNGVRDKMLLKHQLTDRLLLLTYKICILVQ